MDIKSEQIEAIVKEVLANMSGSAPAAANAPII